MEKNVKSEAILFEVVQKPDYCIDLTGDCSKCKSSIKERALDCRGNRMRLEMPKIINKKGGRFVI